MASFADTPVRPFPPLAVARVAIGLGQGFALWLLYGAAQAHAWPASAPVVFAPLVLVALFIPIVALTGLGNLRPLTFAWWLVGALVLVVVIGLHEAARNPVPASGAAVFEPRIGVLAALALALFIAHALVVAGDADRRPIAAYPTYFDVAWKHEVQLLLSLLFLGLFWAVLWLGAELFRLIDIGALLDLIGREWFAMPLSALAFAYALHVTDVRVGLVQGMRNLLLVLLSWLLPVAALLIIGFIASLPFTGLAPLWRTSHGSEIVLIAAAVLVVLLNTAYREGEADARPVVLQWAGSAAALCLPLLVAISAYGLALRVGQHGWTEQRIVGVALLVIAGCYAAGYAWAALASRPWLRGVETANATTAFVILAAIVALTTPIADPDRLAVADQVARLEAGRVSPDQFDFNYLRFHSGRYGLEALARLKSATGPNAAALRKRAEDALALKTPGSTAAPPPSKADFAGMAVFPPGQNLPKSFAQQNWSAYPQSYLLPLCLRRSDVACEAFVTAGDARGAIIVIAEMHSYGRSVAFQQDAGGVWQVLGTLSRQMRCKSVREALRAGKYRWLPPLQMDLEVAGARLTVAPPLPTIAASCP